MPQVLASFEVCAVFSFKQLPVAAAVSLLLQRYGEVSLLGCLRHYVHPETLGCQSRWRCSACQQDSHAIKQMSFRRLAPLMCFHVKRFEHQSGQPNRPRKLDVHVTFPLSGLDMEPFLTASLLRKRVGWRGVGSEGDCAAAGVGEEGGQGLVVRAAAASGGVSAGVAGHKEPNQQQQLGAAAVGGLDEGGGSSKRYVYDLFGVVSHLGDMQGGHYIAFIKSGGFWYRCDDAWITMVEEEEVAACQAYMLFYAHRDFFGGGEKGRESTQEGQGSPAEHQQQQQDVKQEGWKEG